MAKKRIKVPSKTKSELQKEINSECPFCFSNDVGCFEIHHIDQDPMNNIFNNLLMLCPTCHSKIGNGDIPIKLVFKKKYELENKIARIEFVGITLESSKCNWQTRKGNNFSFFDDWKGKSDFPLINFTFINQTKSTIALKSIDAKIKVLPSGMIGIGDPFQAGILKSIARYKVHMRYGDNASTLKLKNPIYAYANAPFLIQIELSEGYDHIRHPIIDRKAVYISFNFTVGTVNIPTIYFNCSDENEPLKRH